MSEEYVSNYLCELKSEKAYKETAESFMHELESNNDIVVKIRDRIMKLEELSEASSHHDDAKSVAHSNYSRSFE